MCSYIRALKQQDANGTRFFSTVSAYLFIFLFSDCKAGELKQIQRSVCSKARSKRVIIRVETDPSLHGNKNISGNYT